MFQRIGNSKQTKWSLAVLLKCLISISACSSSGDKPPADDDLNGTTLAVGAPGYAVSTKGSVYVFILDNGRWKKQAAINPSDSTVDDGFGQDLSLSANGNTLAVGAFVFTRQHGNWTEQAFLKASNHNTGDAFGSAVSLSADGRLLAVGTSNERSYASGVNGNQNDDSEEGSGAVYIFSLKDSAWRQTAYLKARNGDVYDYFGDTTLSADGNTLAVSAGQEGKNYLNMPGPYYRPLFYNSPAVYLY